MPLRALVLAATVLTALACDGGAPTTTDGRELFEKICAQCHGPDGHASEMWKAKLGVPDLADPAVQGRLTDAQIVETITNGSRSGKMPAWKGTLTPAQIDAVATYVRTLGGR
jgi:cytochrome c oxidase cbb3-type subunit 3